MKLNKKIIISGICSLCWLFFPLQLKAYTTVRETVKTVDSINIDIEVMMPDKSGSFPVLFFVHGGGWDHGTSKATPGPQNLSSAPMLCDALGVVFVGVDYRCKNQNGDFEKALQDVMDVYKYARKNAKRFKCNFKKCGFSGASAGTPLSAITVQRLPDCKLYIGIYGKYDFITPGLGGYWPSEETLTKYKITTQADKFRASAVNQIRRNPPSTLLIHGDADETTGFHQSLAFVDSIKKKGGFASTCILKDVSHGFYKPTGGIAFVEGSVEVMEHLIRVFKIKNPDRQLAIDKLNKSIDIKPKDK